MSEDEAFWRFSLVFYERPGVADALIALQDRGGFDVNLILFALWLGISGRGLLGGDTLAAKVLFHFWPQSQRPILVSSNNDPAGWGTFL